MSERKKLAIIDGKSVFYRGYYAMPNLSTKDGTPTGGVYGFCAMALELIKRLKPDYVCVAWDKPKTNIRKRLAIYPEYKAGRKPAPADFYAQIPILHEVLEAFNWPMYELDDYEADDIMCSIAKRAASEDIETMLISSDLDMLQCVGPITHMYALKKGLTNIDRFDIEAFEQKYGIGVDQFLDLKSLKGDSSDNIPGVPGIGEKGAADLLREYKTLDGIYENIALVKNTLAKKLEAGRDLAYLSKEVARLYDDAPIKLDLEQMDVNKLDVVRLEALLKRLEFRSLLRNLPEAMKATSEQKTAHRVEGAVVSGGLVDLHELPLKHIASTEELEEINISGEVVLHARSMGKHGKDPSILIMSDSEHCYAIDLRQSSLGLKKLLASQISNISFVIGYDLKNTFKILLELGVDRLPSVSHDCLISSFIIDSLQRNQSLTDLAAGELDYEGDLDNLDDDEILTKATELCAVLKELANIQAEKISEVTSLIKLSDKVDYPVIPVLARMERAGIKIDPGFFGKLSEEMTDKISDLEQTIYGYADQEFNISSPSQLSEILFVKLGLPTAASKKGKSGNFSTASDVLNKLRDLHPIIDEIEKYRELAKLKNTYIDTLPSMVDDNDRIHTTFNITIAATGRLSSVDPNLQNIPVRTEVGKQIRRGFIVENGNVLISADYSQFELRIAAAMSNDGLMIKAFNENRDIHIETAALVNGIKPEEVTKEMRYAAKAVNFGILYGQGVHGLSEGAGISYADAKKFIDKYFEVRPSLRGMIDKFKDQAKNRGYVETLLGRRRPTPDALSSNFMVREGALRAAINMPIQGTAADLTKLAMIELDKKLPKSAQQLLQIHDSIMVECSEEEAEEVSIIMQETMENIYPKLGVNLKVDVSIGKNWGEL
jgi:DNA polymerase I